jgi:tRNA (guanine-N7-)-methyltransferase
MPRDKLKKFKELSALPNVRQLTDDDLKDKLDNFLAQKKLVILELGCGKGEYSNALAKNETAKQFIGVDIQGERLWYGAKQALEEKLANVLFLRIQIENLLDYFDKNSISEIWLTFPDPYPKTKHLTKRLTSPRFLNIYKKILQPDGIVHLKTDNQNLFKYSLETIEEFGGQIIESHSDLCKDKINDPKLAIQTTFEKKCLTGEQIYYLKFQL